MNAQALTTAGVAALLGAFLAACGSDSVAGKTTTTTNGGDLVALGPDGTPLSGCVALAARSWDTTLSQPGQLDTLRGDSVGRISLGGEAYAFVEIRDASGALGARVLLPRVEDGFRQSVSLDSLRDLSGVWADRAGIANGSLVLDSSLVSAATLGPDGAFTFRSVAPGSYGLLLRETVRPARPFGEVHLGTGSRGVRYTGSGNVVLTGDTTGSPFWIDDFEPGGLRPLLRSAQPDASPWFVWWTWANMVRPATSSPEDILSAIVPDTSRGGSSFQARFATTGPNAWVALGVTNLHLDLGARREVCLGYRSDSPMVVEFQRDSIAGQRPTFWDTLPRAAQWRDTCAALSNFSPGPGTPDSLGTWSAFGRRVLVIQFLATTGATHLDLDDLRLR